MDSMFSQEFATYSPNILPKPFSVECFLRMENLRTSEVSSLLPDTPIDSLLNIGRNKDQMTSWEKIFYEDQQWPSGSDAGFPIQGFCIQDYWVAPRLTQPFIFLRLIK